MGLLRAFAAVADEVQPSGLSLVGGDLLLLAHGKKIVTGANQRQPMSPLVPGALRLVPLPKKASLPQKVSVRMDGFVSALRRQLLLLDHGSVQVVAHVLFRVRALPACVRLVVAALVLVAIIVPDVVVVVIAVVVVVVVTVKILVAVTNVVAFIIVVAVIVLSSL